MTCISWCADQVGAGKPIGKFAYTTGTPTGSATTAGGDSARARAPSCSSTGAAPAPSPRSTTSGIVEAVRTDGAIVTIEGNTADAVRRRVRRTGIAGYGYPAYSSGGKPTQPGKPGTRGAQMARPLLPLPHRGDR